MDNWYSEVKAQSEPDALLFLVGNQSDREDQREVGLDKAEQFKRIKALDYNTETSAKTGNNVTNTFTNVAKMLYQKNISKILSAKRDLTKRGKRVKGRNGGKKLDSNTGRTGGSDENAKKGCKC